MDDKVALPPSRPTKRAPDGWWAARFLCLFLNYERFPFRKLVLASRR